MASLCKKRGASGALSPFWQAVVTFNHRKIWVSTKCTDRRIARAVSDRWTRGAWLAQRWELNQAKADRLLGEIQAITKCPATLEQSRELFKRLMAETTGETYAGENFSDYCAEWLKMRAANTKPATMIRYERVVSDFLESLPERRRSSSVGSITAGEVRRFRDGLAAGGLSESTVNLAHAILGGLFNDARKQGVIVHNVAEAIPKLKAHDVDARMVFSDSQLKALVNAADVEWRGMILLGIHCGTRIGDAADLRWSNVDLVNRTLTFEQKKVAHRKKKHERVTVIYLHADVMTYLEGIGSCDDPNGALFPSLCGRSTSGSTGLSVGFAEVMKRASITPPLGLAKAGRGRQLRLLSYHSLRHSFISRLANSEVAMEIRKSMSGHSSDAQHERYSHLSIELQKAAIGKLASVLG
jgi:integrase